MTTRSPRHARYLHLDVFTDRPLEGNQLAVFPDAHDIPGPTMQRIAQEMAFSETTFLLPPEAPGTDIRMRIFTPGRELPMAGHPTIGSTFVAALERIVTPPAACCRFGLGVGPVPVDLEWRGSDLSFAWMTQGSPEFGATWPDVSSVGQALGIDPVEITETGLPVQDVSCGVPFLLVPIRTRAAVDRALLDGRAARQLSPKGEPLPVFVFSLEPDSDGARVYSRMFAPTFGIVEDPATGSASGPLGCYLVRHGAVSPADASHLVSRQGVKMGRPSTIHIAVGVEGDRLTSVKVGGTAVIVGEGTLVVP
jgi:trans-2,3-dihydro-3-hydroxyanthranilate isomerase